MESPTVTTALMNWAVPQWNQINAIKRSISGAKLLEFAFRLRGIAMAQTTAMITRTSKIVDQSLAPTTSSSARTPSVFSRLTFAMEKMIAVTIPTNLTNMLALLHHSDARSVSGNVLE